MARMITASANVRNHGVRPPILICDDEGYKKFGKSKLNSGFREDGVDRFLMFASSLRFSSKVLSQAVESLS